MTMEDPKKVLGKHLKIVRKNPDNIRSIWVNDFLVTHSRSEFFLIFSAFEPPAILDENEFNKLEEIEAVARARLVISPEVAEAMSKALSINIEGYKQEVKGDVPEEKIE